VVGVWSAELEAAREAPATKQLVRGLGARTPTHHCESERWQLLWQRLALALEHCWRFLRVFGAMKVLDGSETMRGLL